MFSWLHSYYTVAKTGRVCIHVERATSVFLGALPSQSRGKHRRKSSHWRHQIIRCSSNKSKFSLLQTPTVLKITQKAREKALEHPGSFLSPTKALKLKGLLANKRMK